MAAKPAILAVDDDAPVLRAVGGLLHLLLIVALVIVIYRRLTNRPVW